MFCSSRDSILATNAPSTLADPKRGMASTLHTTRFPREKDNLQALHMIQSSRVTNEKREKSGLAMYAKCLASPIPPPWLRRISCATPHERLGLQSRVLQYPTNLL